MTPEKASGPAALVLTASVARRYYLDGTSKSEIAADLGLSRFKVARMIEQARATGVVGWSSTRRAEIDLDLSVRLGDGVRAAPLRRDDSPEDDDRLLRNGLGRAAAELLAEIVEPGDVLGLAWARALMAMRASLTARPLRRGAADGRAVAAG